MIKRDIAQLAVYPIEADAEYLPLASLQKLYLEKTSEIIYITKDDNLYGIICMGEALRGRECGEVFINKRFTRLNGYNVIKAREIFQRKGNIHKIPVVNEQGRLLGDYSRWDDVLYVKRNQENLMKEKELRMVLGIYEHVYLVRPVAEKYDDFFCLKTYLESFQIEFMELGKKDIYKKLSEKAVCIFIDEDERRGIQCAYGLKPRPFYGEGESLLRYDMSVDENCKIRFITYKELLLQALKQTQFEKLSINKEGDILYDEVNDKATILLSALKRSGVKCFSVYIEDKKEKLSKYAKNFKFEIEQRNKTYPQNLREPWTKKRQNEEFYGELYENEDYEKEIAQRELFLAMSSFSYISGISGKYCNAQNGRRTTCFQPKEYIGTIYFMGPCLIVGVYVEDQYTIASLLQKQLLSEGYAYRVENCGQVLRFDAGIDSRLEEIGDYQANDIVIYQLGIGEGYADGIESICLADLYEKYQIPSSWVTDGYSHCNHKVNSIIADNVLEMIEPYLKRGHEKSEKIVQFDVHQVMYEYIYNKYIKCFFSSFTQMQFSKIGALVMECNPLNRESSYLIEQAAKDVDYLIVFVLEQCESIFSFEERFQLAEKSIKNLPNVMVVPSGDFVLSKRTFPEFYSGADNEVVAINAEYDVSVFVNYIAKPLHITYRFAEEESKRKITKKYNEIMSRILPQNGISYIEIPKMAKGNEIINLFQVQKDLKDEKYDEVFAMLPETTKQYLMEQM